MTAAHALGAPLPDERELTSWPRVPASGETNAVVSADALRSPDDAATSEPVMHFVIEGMHCAACAGLIEAAAVAVPGVSVAEVNAASRRLVVHWARPVQGHDAIALADAVRRAGYGLHPAQQGDDAALRRRETRDALWRLFVAGFCMMQVMMLTMPAYLAAPGDIAGDLAALMRWAAWVLTLPVVFFSCGPFFRGAGHALRARRIGMDLPVALGIAVTFVAGTGATFDPGGVFGHDAYFDSLTMFVTFLLAGRWLDSRARERSTQALDAMLQRLPEAVVRLDDAGTETLVAVSQLKPGDRVRVALGQAFPGDGCLLAGHTRVDESLLTGESLPVGRAVGEAVSAGTLNVGAPVVVRLHEVGQGTRYRQIVDLVQRALCERPPSLRLADRWAGRFLWAVLLLAVGAALAWSTIDPTRAVWVAVSVLIVTCPCALSLAAPAALLSATDALARRGVLVQRLDALEALARVDIACFDKTGTLTQDRLTLAQVRTGGADPGARDTLLSTAASLARHSQHPVSRALVEACPQPSTRAWRDVQEHAGLGLEAHEGPGRLWRLGHPQWVGVPADLASTMAQGRVQLACGLQTRADAASMWVHLCFDETLRPDADAVLRELRSQGVEPRLLSGDGDAAAQAVAARLGIAQARGSQRPEDKLAAVRRWQAQGHCVLMVGDGLNDGPVLAGADVSVALSHGSALARQRADFVVLGSRLGEVASARRLARRALRIVRQNLVWSAAYNFTCIPLALVGWLPPWAAGAGMALSSLGVVLNALRLSR